MKKVLLSLVVVATGFWSQAQVSCVGVSPGSIAGDYEFEWADPAGGDWSTPDFLLPGVYVQDTLAIVDDGTPGTNPQGNPVSAEGCSPLINGVDVNGKIAVIYRNTCEFGTKALNAQNAGAVAVIIINRDNEVIPMGGGADGGSVTIPVVMLSSVDGLSITNAMANGPVVMFLGNKIGLYADDAGMDNQFTLISPWGTASNALFDGFELGCQFINFGSNVQNNVTVNATIVGPSGTVYDETVGPLTMNPTDTIGVYAGFTNEFPVFNLGGVGNYPNGEYTLTYTLSLGTTTDEDPIDNVYVSKFTVNDNLISRANLDGSGLPFSDTYPSNTDGEYQSCMYFDEANSGILGVEGMWFTPQTDTSVNTLVGEQVLINVYEWNDPWVDLSDAGFGTANATYQNLIPVISTSVDLLDDNQTEVPQYVAFTPSEQIAFSSGQRYLVCAQTFTAYVAFGYDSNIDYDGNVNVNLMPVQSIYTQDNANTSRWWTGWSGSTSPSIAIQTIPAVEVGLEETGAIDGTVYPNPTNGEVVIKLASNENATLVVTDMAGKVVATTTLSFASGAANFSTDGFENGMYLFNLTTDNGSTAQFTVVKK